MAAEVLVSSSIIVPSVLVANVVVGLLVGLGRFVVIWGFLVVAPGTVFGFGFRVVGYDRPLGGRWGRRRVGSIVHDILEILKQNYCNIDRLN